MESSNSGSLQSSSGNAGAGAGADNEEYDSRTQSISSFLNPSTHFNHHLRPPSTDTTFFDPSSVSSFSNPVHDLGSVWSRNFRPDPNVADFSSTTYANPSRMDANTNTNTKTGRGSDHHHHHHHVGVTTKNPKKRTRASRRAPTTVLTTDTTNFRQMVQEFTGIPTAPFSGDSFSRRLGHAGDAGIGPLFPLRPSVQKIQPQQPSFLNSTTANTYQLPPSGIHEFQKQPSGFMDLQNPMLSFQSLLQTTIPQQINDNSNTNATKSNHLSGFPSSSKRWRCQDGKSESFEGVNGNTENIGDYKLNSGLENVVVSSGDQIEGNEDSWICPSN